MKLDAPGLQNDIVSLTPLGDADRTTLKESGAVEAMWQWMPVIATGTNFESYYDFILELKARGDFLPFCITRQSDKAFAGVAGFLDINRTHRRLRIGYIWHPEAMRGTDIHPATNLALIERARQARIRRIEFHAAEANERALKAAERIGARKEGVLRNYMRVADGRWANMTVFSLIDDEMKAAALVLRDRITALQEA